MCGMIPALCFVYCTSSVHFLRFLDWDFSVSILQMDELFTYITITVMTPFTANTLVNLINRLKINKSMSVCLISIWTCSMHLAAILLWMYSVSNSVMIYLQIIIFFSFCLFVLRHVSMCFFLLHSVCVRPVEQRWRESLHLAHFTTRKLLHLHTHSTHPPQHRETIVLSARTLRLVPLGHVTGNVKHPS